MHCHHACQPCLPGVRCISVNPNSFPKTTLVKILPRYVTTSSVKHQIASISLPQTHSIPQRSEVGFKFIEPKPQPSTIFDGRLATKNREVFPRASQRIEKSLKKTNGQGNLGEEKAEKQLIGKLVISKRSEVRFKFLKPKPQPSTIFGGQLSSKSREASPWTFREIRFSKFNSSHKEATKKTKGYGGPIFRKIQTGKEWKRKYAVRLIKTASSTLIRKLLEPVSRQIQLPLITKHFERIGPVIKKTPQQLEVGKVCSRLEIRKIHLHRVWKQYSRKILTRIQNHFGSPLVEIRKTPFNQSNSSQGQQVRVLTRSRKGPGQRSRRQWKTFYINEPWEKRRIDRFKDTRFISLRSFQPSSITNIGVNLDRVDPSWFSNYAVVAAQTQALQVLPRTERLVWPRMITSDMNARQVLEIWQNAHPRIARSRWQNYMLWALQRNPEIALKSLDVTISHSIPEIPRHVVKDCLDYLAAVFLKGVSSPDSSKLEHIYHLTCGFAKASHHKGAGLFSINQQTVYLILAHCSNEQAENLYQIICQHKIELYSFTLLHFLKRFGDMGKSSLCVDVIQKITECGIDLGSDLVQSALVTLLRTRYDENWYKSSSFILAESLRMGIRPRIFMYNVIILNSIEAGDYETAFHIYNVAQENGRKPDAITYNILLRGCWESMNRDYLDLVLYDIEADGTLTVDDDLVFSILYASLKIEIHKDGNLDFTNLLPIYAKYCGVQPLQELGLLNIEYPPQSLNPPSPRVLAIMLIAYIRQCLDSSPPILGLYQRYWDCVKQGHPLISPIAATDHVANAFILAFGRWHETLEMCTTIIKSMLELQQEKFSGAESSKSSEVAGPTVYTWSILLMSFSRNHLMVAAEKVLSMMKDRGIEPNNVTWNNLVHGYAVIQDIDSTVHSIKRMEVEGHAVDNYTVAGLGRVRDQNLLVEALNDAVDYDKQTAELQDIKRPERIFENTEKQ